MKRVIPILLLRNESLVKTRCFDKFVYVGDPCNTVRIFNELEVDELIFLDITATPGGRAPNLKVLRDISNECFMPLAYGGGITNLDQAKQIFDIGFEKISLNYSLFSNPSLITQIANHFGSQALIGSIDVKRDFFGNYKVHLKSGSQKLGLNPLAYAQQLERLGVGEILLTSIDKEGTWEGFDLDLITLVSGSVNIPVIAHGGAGSVNDIKKVLQTPASAAGIGSMVVFQKKNMGVLVNFPDRESLEII